MIADWVASGYFDDDFHPAPFVCILNESFIIQHEIGCAALFEACYE